MRKGYTIWLTGLSGAGKSTLAQEIHKYLSDNGKKVQILDGDIVRNEIGHLFGYSREERMKMSKVIRLISKLLNDNGIDVIVAAIAPYQEMREINRNEIENYLEIYVKCSLEVCVERDTKGLYKKALRGEVKHVVGIDDVYEIPRSSNIEVDTSVETVEQSMERIKELLVSIL